MAILKPVRKFLINLAMDLMGLSPEEFSVVDMIRDDSRPDEIMPQVEEYLDDKFSSEGKRWTDLGYKYKEEAEHFKFILEQQYDKLEDDE